MPAECTNHTESKLIIAANHFCVWCFQKWMGWWMSVAELNDSSRAEHQAAHHGKQQSSGQAWQVSSEEHHLKIRRICATRWWCWQVPLHLALLISVPSLPLFPFSVRPFHFLLLIRRQAFQHSAFNPAANTWDATPLSPHCFIKVRVSLFWQVVISSAQWISLLKAGNNFSAFRKQTDTKKWLKMKEEKSSRINRGKAI